MKVATNVLVFYILQYVLKYFKNVCCNVVGVITLTYAMYVLFHILALQLTALM